MKRNVYNTLPALLTWLLLAVCPTEAGAYNDHRVSKLDSIEALLNGPESLTDEKRMECYKNLMRGYLPKDSEKHDKYCRLALGLSYKHNWLDARENALVQLGLQHYGQEDFDEAERYFRWALALTDSMAKDKRYSQTDIDDNLSQLYGSMGNLYNLQDKALLAIEYYQKALPIFEKNGWLESLSLLHHNIAELYLSMANIEEAERHYLLAIGKGEESGDSLIVAIPQKGLAKAYIYDGNYEKGREVLQAAYTYFHAHQDEEPQGYAEVLSALVQIHLMDDHEDLPRAKAYAQEALSYTDGELMMETRCDIYAAAAQTEMKASNWQQALKYAQKSIHSNDDEATYSDVSCYELLANIHSHLGNSEKAIEYTNKMRRMMERFATQHYQSGLSQMEVLYETKEKEAEIKQLQREKRWYLWGGLLALLVLLLATLVFCLLWRSIRLHRKTTIIQARLDGEVAERVRIARDLHDRLGGLLTAIRLNVGSNDEKTLSLTDEAIREMRNVSHHLLPDSLSRFGLHPALRDFCATMKNVSFTFSGQERHIRHEEAVYCIVHELVNNAVKSSGAQHIAVSLKAEEQQTVITVSDDGIGLPKNAETAGAGLGNIHERVASLGGWVDISSEEGKGTEIRIKLKNETEYDKTDDY